MADVTDLRQEILECPQAVARLLADGQRAVLDAAQALRQADPTFVVTVARGSSDHAATFLKYAIELTLGIPVASVGPSVASVYHRPLKLSGGACLAVSQSGKSPDIVAMAQMARSNGAVSIALTNDPEAPLALVSDHVLALHAGPERSVAATKTFINTCVAGLWLLAEWADDAALRLALLALPSQLQDATQIDWPDLRAALVGQEALFCLGRGPGLAMSNEAALKLKETCLIHAESFSAAEVLHGPVSLIAPGFPVLVLCAADAAAPFMAQVAADLGAKEALVFGTCQGLPPAQSLPSIRTGHPLTDPLAQLVSFYAMVEKLAVARGLAPDVPRHLRKVTQTV